MFKSKYIMKTLYTTLLSLSNHNTFKPNRAEIIRMTHIRSHNSIFVSGSKQHAYLSSKPVLNLFALRRCCLIVDAILKHQIDV